MPESTYPAPINQLLTYGDCRNFLDWPDYVAELGLTAEHIPDLIRMALDPELNWADSDSLEVWAPTHAWRALGQLQAEEAIAPLLSMADEFADITEGNDWYWDDLPTVFAMIGAASIPPIIALLADRSHPLDTRTFAGNCLQAIGETHADLRLDCVVALTQQLEQIQKNDPELNGFLITNLIELAAVESAAAIQQAFAAKRVDASITGDWDDVQIDLGLKTEAEADELRNWIDAEHLGAQAAKPSSAPRGFGGSSSASKKGKKKK
jgi:hypothetical protein